MPRQLPRKLFNGLDVPPPEVKPEGANLSETELISREVPITYKGPGNINITETPTESRIVLELKKAARKFNLKMPSGEGKG